MTEQVGLFRERNQEPSPIQANEAEALRWKEVLKDEFEADYFKELKQFVKAEREAGKTIYPPDEDILNSLKYTAFENVRVVILGQDPYHGPNQAHGLCFSVKPGVAFPPSLQNIFKELYADLGVPMPRSGTLTKWAKQGVLLLNAVLTVEAGQAASHQGKGWEQFTDAIVNALNQKKDGLIFVLWGSHAQKKGAVIDPVKHHILKAPHPSPLSAHRGFFGCKHFSQINQILRERGEEEINWAL